MAERLSILTQVTKEQTAGTAREIDKMAKGAMLRRLIQDRFGEGAIFTRLQHEPERDGKNCIIHTVVFPPDWPSDEEVEALVGDPE